YRVAKVAEGEAQGFSALRSGLGLPDGAYKLVTPDSSEIYGIRYVQRKSDGQKFQLTCVAGTLSNDKGLARTFGLMEGEASLVVNVAYWEMIEPNQSYHLEIRNGKVAMVS